MQHDLSHWPLVITVAAKSSTLTEMEAFLQTWEQWLAGGELFAMLRVFTHSESLTHPPGSPPLAKQWLQQQGEAIRQQVMGMATVVPLVDYERLRKMNAEKLFGVPAATFADVPAALRWMKERVYAPRDLMLDAAAISATIETLVNPQSSNRHGLVGC